MGKLSILQAIQAELKAPKSQYNNFGKYAYRNCEDILEAVKPLCVKHGGVLVLSDSVVQIGDRYYVEATAKLCEAESGALIMEVKAFAREEAEKKGMDGSQVTGAASSYARKYALNGLFNIDDTKDADSNELRQTAQNNAGTAKPQAVNKQTKTQDKTDANTNDKVKKAMDTVFEFGGKEYRLGDLSEEWLINNKDRERYAAIKPQIEILLKAKYTEKAKSEEETPFDVKG